ncbi:hypothetical protein NX722_22690 [Endozoicomonas gorgoniicola]|uniref:Peptidase C58 YopT-type domain-containing protein n=1 Tax=Endozoicomonas gorgoniicola TaxID=1234144 RepID=A0ABT3N178_9GAMM|nr:hypothetical protein [Endozoicomonas gorgoniicola]MCW7555387.1 hypothetical protein [Endozoicomonas gorgoniicola]
MGKLYDYQTADQVVFAPDGSPVEGACAGAVCLWLLQRFLGQPLMIPPDLATATALQQAYLNTGPLMLEEQRNALVYIGYKLHAIGLHTVEEFGTKDVVALIYLIFLQPGLYYLSVTVSGGGLHAVGMQVLERGRCYLFDPDDGLSELSFAEVVDYFILECDEDEGMFSAIKVS